MIRTGCQMPSAPRQNSSLGWWSPESIPGQWICSSMSNMLYMTLSRYIYRAVHDQQAPYTATMIVLSIQLTCIVQERCSSRRFCRSSSSRTRPGTTRRLCQLEKWSRPNRCVRFAFCGLYDCAHTGMNHLQRTNSTPLYYTD